MKTSVLVKRNSALTAFSRCVLPGDENGDVHPKRLEDMKLLFVPAHDVTGQEIISLQPYKTKPFLKHEPDQIRSSWNVWMNVKHGAVREARVLTDEYVCLLHEADMEIERAIQRRHFLMQEAWRHGRALRVVDLEEIK